jgi:hypothetical protein
MTRRCARGCVRSRLSGRAGGTGARITGCARRAGASTTSARSGCGARKASGSRSGAASAAGSATPRCRRAAGGRAARARVGAGLPVRPDRRRARAQAAQRRRRVHPRSAGDARGAAHRRRRHCHRAGAARRQAWRAGAHPLRQRPRADRARLRDWCRFATTETAFIEPGSPWQNPYVESFHSRVRDELLDVEEFACLAEARVVIADWHEDYNQRRPHSSLGMKTPAAFAATCTAVAVTEQAARHPRGRDVRTRRQVPSVVHHQPTLTQSGPKNGVRPCSPGTPKFEYQSLVTVIR